MAVTYKGLTIKFGGDTTGLQSALKQIQSETRKTNSDLREINKSLNFNPGNTVLLEQKVRALNNAYNDTKSKLDAYKQALQQLEDKKRSGEQLTAQEQRQYDSLQRSIMQCENQMERYSGQLKKTQNEYEASQTKVYQFGQSLENNADKFKAVGERMQSIGAGATKFVSVPLAAIGTAAAKTAIDVDTALTGVRKTVDATEEEYKALKDAAVEYSKTNAISATDILNAEELAGQLGVGKDNLFAFAKVATGLDLSTNMNVEQASTNLARFANVTNMGKLEGEDAARAYEAYGNVIVGLGNNCATTESEISDFSLRMASAGTQAGMSEADILGVAAAMSSLGLEAQAGGSSFSKTISEISVAVATGNENLEKYAQIAGMSAQEFADYWKRDATNAFIDFVGGLSTSGEDMNVVLQDLGIKELRQSDALRRLAGNTDLVRDAVSLANKEWQNGTALSNEVANKNDSMASKFEMLKNKVTAVLEKIGKPLVDAITDAIDAAEPFLEKIGDMAQAFSDMDQGQQRAILGVGAFAAAFGPALMGVGGFVKGLGDLGTDMKKAAETYTMISGKIGGIGTAISEAGGVIPAVSGAFSSFGSTIAGVAIGPVGIIAAAIAALVLSFKTLWDTNEGFRNTVQGVWDSVVAKFNEAGERIGEALRPIAEAMGIATDGMSSGLEVVQAVLGKLWEGIANLFGPSLVNLITEAGAVIKGIVDVIVGVFEVIGGIIEGFKTGDWSMFVNGLKSIWDGFVSIITAPFQGAIEAIKYTLEQMGYKWDEVVGGLRREWEDFCSFFTGIWDGIKTGAADFCSNVAATWEGLKNTASSTFAAIKDEIDRDLSDAKTVGESTMGAFGAAMRGDWQEAERQAQTAFETIDRSITDHLRSAKDSGIPIVSDLASGALEKWEWLKTEGAAKFANLAQEISNNLGNAKSWAEEKGREIQEFWESIPDRIIGFFSGIGDRISDAFGSIHFPSPHVEWDSIGIGDISVPIPNVQWYAKGGAIAPNSPRLIGVGDSREREWIEPESKLLAMIESAVRNVRGGGDVNVEVNVDARIEGRRDAYEVGQDIGRGISSVMKQRGYKYA